jgi:hypothetical protein
MKQQSILLLSILLLTFSLAACGGEVAALPTAVPTGTSTIIPTITSTPTPLSKKAYLPTYQAKLTERFIAEVAGQTATAALWTQTPTRTPSPTRTPKASYTPTATLPITVTPGYEQWGNASYSPDGKWFAVKYSFEEQEQRFIALVVGSMDGSANWIVDQLPVEGHFFYYPTPFLWSKDGKHFYFKHYLIQDGCFSLGNGGENLFRVNLEDGEKELVFEQFASEMALSPDETKLAYVDFGDSGVRILDIETGVEIELERLYPELLIDQIGLVWSPDGNKVAYAIMHYVCEPDSPTSIMIIDVNQASQELIIQDDERGMHPIAWVDENTILLGNVTGQYWHFNPRTGEVTEISE